MHYIIVIMITIMITIMIMHCCILEVSTWKIYLSEK